MIIINNVLEARLNHALDTQIKQLTSNHPLKEAYHYAVLPAGKLFRPKLVWNTFLDLDPKNALNILNDESKFFEHPITLLACALEIHHAYTLVHDDLPAMDNDLVRRGKPSLHAKFGHWQAILVGDGLLNMSYQILAKINHQEAMNVLKIFSHGTGPKGLIEGQVLDLSHEMNLSLENLIRTHELKTARLIQIALAGSTLLSVSDKEKSCDFWRFGSNLGVIFQLLDDLMELTDSQLSPHEIAVNPYLKYFNRTFPALISEWIKLKSFLKKNKLPHLESMINDYLEKNLNQGKSKISNIMNHIEQIHIKNNEQFNPLDKKQLENFLNGNITF